MVIVDRWLNAIDTNRGLGGKTDAIMMVDKLRRPGMVEHNGRDKSGPYDTGNKLLDQKIKDHNRVCWLVLYGRQHWQKQAPAQHQRAR